MPSYVLKLQPTTTDAAAFYKPTVLSTENAGFDLFVPEEVVFAPNERKLVSMQVKAVLIDQNPLDETPVHYWMPPRSSISKTGLLLLNSVGVIDKSYRGELMAYLWNTTVSSVTVKKGDRLVQIVAPDMGPIRSVHLVSALDSTERGEGGFGSSGR